MIHNILFDMGNVLLRFDPPVFIARLGLNEADSALLLREVFQGVEWVQLDRGSLTDEEALRAMCARLPARLHAAARELTEHWDDNRLPVEGMDELVAELSARGYGLYLLTNASLRHHQYWPKSPLAPYFEDRIMLSSDWKLLKPDAAFYEKAFSLFGLDRANCLFIDDAPANVEAALRIGLKSILFRGDTAELRESLRHLLPE